MYRLVSSSATVYQVFVALECLMETESVSKFGIVFGNGFSSGRSSFSSKFAYNLFDRFQASTSKSLAFIVSINAANYMQVVGRSKPEGKEMFVWF